MKDNRPLTLEEFNAIRHRAARENAEAMVQLLFAIRTGLRRVFAAFFTRARRGSI
jgi:hypothetical protein